MRTHGVKHPIIYLRKLILGVALITLAIPPTLVTGEPADENVRNQPNLTKLIAQLSNDSFQIRKKATEDLWKMGQAALPALRKSAAGSDPEAAARANELIYYITAGVIFDSPQQVKTLVLKFSRSNTTTKLKILDQLMKLGHLKQVLHLAKLEKNPDARAQMSGIVKATAHRAASDAIIKGDLNLAHDILKLSADDPQSMLMLAWFYKHQGQLDKQLEKADRLPGKNGALWRMSLHRAAANLTKSIEEAEKAGLQKNADAMRVLDGNPLPWLRRNTELRKHDTIYTTGSLIQQHRLEGRHKNAAALIHDLSELAQDSESAVHTAIALAANGFRQEAINVLAKWDIARLFNYYDSTEFPQQCIDLLGIPPDAKPPYTTWVKEFTENAIEKQDSNLYNQLLLLASFLVSHGQPEHAIDVLTPMMIALEADGSDEWFDLLSTMEEYGLGTQVCHFIEKRGNKDGEADLAVKKMLSRVSSESLSNIWNLLKKRNNQNIPTALHEIALLAGIIADTNNKTDKLHQALIDDVADQPPADQKTRLTDLYIFSIHRNNIATASKVADRLAPLGSDWVPRKAALDAALQRWGKVEPNYAASAKKSPGNYYNLTNWYIALRKLGRDQQAREIYPRILLLSMGNAAALNQIGIQLQTAGYEELSKVLWQHAAILAKPGKSDYYDAIIYLTQLDNFTQNKGQWNKAASLAEIYSQLIMRGTGNASIHSGLRARFYADFFQGMHLLESGQKPLAIAKLNACRELIPGDGTLADNFFPTLRSSGIGKLYDQWFKQSYHHIALACKLYPRSHNSQNTAAWLASRSVRKLDAALIHAEAALKEQPTQGAYLDTMAEIWFAKGNRAKAIQWSEKAIAASISNAQGNPRTLMQVLASYKQLLKQLEHFKNDPLPR